MKKLLVIFVLSLIIFSCDDDLDSVFDKTPTERIQENKSEFFDALNSSNWVIELFPASDQKYGGFSVYADFNADYTVALFNELNRNTLGTTSYDVITRQGSVLTFNEYNEGIHFFSSPETNIPDGIEGDYEFIYIKREDNTLYTKGVKTRNDIRLYSTDLSPDEYLQKLYEVEQILRDNTKIPYISKPQGNYVVSVTNRVLTIKKIGTTEEIEIPFVYRPNGLRLYKPVEFNGVTFDYLYLKLVDGVYQFESENGEFIISLGELLFDFSQGFVLKIEDGLVSSSFLQYFNDLNSSINDKLTNNLSFTTYGGTEIVIGRAVSGIYAYETKFTYFAPDVVSFDFPKEFIFANENGKTLLNYIASKSTYKIEDFDNEYYKIVSLSDADFWFLVRK